MLITGIGRIDSGASSRPFLALFAP